MHESAFTPAYDEATIEAPVGDPYAEATHEHFDEGVEATPSLFEQYSEMTVTIRGVTGTLGALRGLCPIPDDDPRMTDKAVHDWTVEVLRESGVELTEEQLGKKI